MSSCASCVLHPEVQDMSSFSHNLVLHVNYKDPGYDFVDVEDPVNYAHSVFSWGKLLIFPHGKDRDEISIALEQYIEDNLSSDEFGDICLNYGHYTSDQASTTMTYYPANNYDEEPETIKSRGKPRHHGGKSRPGEHFSPTSCPCPRKRSRAALEVDLTESDDGYEPEPAERQYHNRASKKARMSQGRKSRKLSTQHRIGASKKARTSKGHSGKSSTLSRQGGKRIKSEAYQGQSSDTRSPEEDQVENDTEPFPNYAEPSTKASGAPATTPTAPKRSGWSDAEKLAIFHVIRDLQQEEIRLNNGHIVSKDMKLYKAVSAELATRGIYRSPLACKNQWCRYGRTDNSWDEKEGRLDQDVEATSTGDK